MAGFEVGSVIAYIKADISDFKNKISDAKKATEGFRDGISTIGKEAAIFTGIATTALIAFGKQSVDASNEAEAAQAQLEHAVINVTHATKDQLKATEDLATALQDKGVLDDDAIKMGLAQLSTFGLSNTAVRKLGGSLADLAVNQFGVHASGEQLSDTANMIAKALNGQFGVLEKSGIRFTELQQNIIKTGTEMEKVKAINEGFAQNLKYTNDVAITTTEGKIAHFIVMWGNLQERVGDVIKGFVTFMATGDLTGEFLRGLGIDEDDPRLNGLFKLREAFVALGNWIAANQALVISFLEGLGIALAALMVIGTIYIAVVALTNPLFLLAAAITLLFVAWQTNFLGIRDITQQVFDVLVFLIQNVVMPIITAVTNWVKQNWSTIAMVTKTTWDLITSILQVAFAGILGIFGILLGLLTGDWKAAWNIINKAGDVGIAGIKNLLTSALNFIGGWGGMLFDELTRPFRQAWDTISGLVNKIKDALDFTKRHSPSVVDIVQKGVKLVNDSLSDLDMPISGLNTSIAPSFTSLGGGGAGNAFNSIQIDLSNAVISDEAGAMRMGEMVGDAIIRKLNSNIRH
jgi:hypothetical protein